MLFMLFRHQTQILLQLHCSTKEGLEPLLRFQSPLEFSISQFKQAFTCLKKKNTPVQLHKIFLNPWRTWRWSGIFFNKNVKEEMQISREKTYSHGYSEFPENQNITWLSLKYSEGRVPYYKEKQPSQFQGVDPGAFLSLSPLPTTQNREPWWVLLLPKKENWTTHTRSDSQGQNYNLTCLAQLPANSETTSCGSMLSDLEKTTISKPKV